MRQFAVLTALWFVVGCSSALHAVELERRIEQAISTSVASVGTITTSTNDGPRYGSAFVVDQDRGWLLTNYHVVAGGHQIAFENAETSSPVPATLVYFEASSDLALLLVTDPSRLPPALELADDSSARQGQFVIAMGSPEGLGQTTTLGLVSATDREVSGSRIRSPFIQIDAAVYQGSSGGPLCNLDGQVVGVVTRRAATGHAAFALPVSLVRRFLRNYQNQEVEEPIRAQGYLGAELQALSRPLARYLDYAGPGIVVTGTYARSAARRAGLQTGDVLVRLDDLELSADTEGAVALVESLITSTGPGTHRLSVIRDGESFETEVELLPFPPCRSEALRTPGEPALVHEGDHCYWFPEGPFVQVTRPWTSIGASVGLRATDDGPDRPRSTRDFPELEPQRGDLITEALGGDFELPLESQLLSPNEGGPMRAVRVLRNGRPRLVLLSVSVSDSRSDISPTSNDERINN